LNTEFKSGLLNVCLILLFLLVYSLNLSTRWSISNCPFWMGVNEPSGKIPTIMTK